jgi:zinc transport system substrate-binding protein
MMMANIRGFLLKSRVAASRQLYTAILSTVFLVFAYPPNPAGAEQQITVGVTLHPYYSWVANIAGDTVRLKTVIPADVDPHSYQMRPQDLKNLEDLDVIVMNGLGHDDYIDDMLKAAGREDIKRIKPNAGMPLIPAAHKTYAFQKEKENSVAYNSHTYVCILGAIQQINTIAAELGRMQPQYVDLYQKNAHEYANTLRNMLRNALQKLKQYKPENISIATVHDGYAYLFQELGITTDAVIQPRHGIEPSARQLADTIERIKRAKANVLFSEVDYQKEICRYHISGDRLSNLFIKSYHGPYTAEKFVQDMPGTWTPSSGLTIEQAQMDHRHRMTESHQLFPGDFANRFCGKSAAGSFHSDVIG